MPLDEGGEEVDEGHTLALDVHGDGEVVPVAVRRPERVEGEHRSLASLPVPRQLADDLDVQPLERAQRGQSGLREPDGGHPGQPRGCRQAGERRDVARTGSGREDAVRHRRADGVDQGGLGATVPAPGRPAVPRPAHVEREVVERRDRDVQRRPVPGARDVVRGPDPNGGGHPGQVGADEPVDVGGRHEHRGEPADGRQVRGQRGGHRCDVEHRHGRATPTRRVRTPGQRAPLGEYHGLGRDRLAVGQHRAGDVEPAVRRPDVEHRLDRVVDDRVARGAQRRHERHAALAQLSQQVPDPAAVDVREVEPGRRRREPVVAARERHEFGEEPALPAGARQVAALGVPDGRPRGPRHLPPAGGPRNERPGPQQRRPVRVVRAQLELECGLDEGAADPLGTVGLRLGAVGGQERADSADPVRRHVKALPPPRAAPR